MSSRQHLVVPRPASLATLSGISLTSAATSSQAPLLICLLQLSATGCSPLEINAGPPSLSTILSEMSSFLSTTLDTYDPHAEDSQNYTPALNSILTFRFIYAVPCLTYLLDYLIYISKTKVMTLLPSSQSKQVNIKKKKKDKSCTPSVSTLLGKKKQKPKKPLLLILCSNPPGGPWLTYHFPSILALPDSIIHHQEKLKLLPNISGSTHFSPPQLL